MRLSCCSARSPAKKRKRLTTSFPNSEPTFSKALPTAEEVRLRSVVPPTAITCDKALEILSSEQGALIETYKNENGEFSGEISERIIVKNEKPYWYVGLLNGKGGTKALLIDGLNGEILAVREII